MAELDRLSDKVYIPPPIKEKAAVTYRKALDKGLVRGRSIAAIAAAALYAACRGSGTPRTLREIAEASLVEIEVTCGTARRRKDQRDLASCKGREIDPDVLPAAICGVPLGVDVAGKQGPFNPFLGDAYLESDAVAFAC